KQEFLEIKNNLRIRMGHTDLRFRFTDHPIKETMLEHTKPSQLSMLLSSGLILPLVWLIFGVAIMFNNYIEETSLVTFPNLLGNIFPLLIFISLWAMAWSITSKIVTRRFYFSFHANWVCCLTLLSIVANNYANYFEFSFSLPGSGIIISFILGVIVTSILINGHLHYSTTLSSRKSRRVSIIASVIILGLVQLMSFLQSPEFSNTPQYSGVIKPPGYILAQQQSLDDFFSHTRHLKSDSEYNSAAFQQ
ncbi:hypothetical protein JYT31_02020, partial [Beggiatoa alba]|nr:hypothetical protein [Beggiatoa alba]